MISAVPFLSDAQVGDKGNTKYIEIRGAHKYIYNKKLGINRLLGGVTCTHQNMIMTCDSAWLYDNNTLDAFGHINVRQGDSIFISGDKLKYNGATRLAALEGNVVCIEKEMTLTTPILTYDLNTSTASYFTGGTIQNKDNTLTSRNGYYHSPSKTLSFKYNVKLKNPQYTMSCDTLQYNTVSRIAYFIGPTKIVADSNTITTERGWYNTTSETCQLLKNSEIISGKQSLRGDSIFYQRNKGYGLALGHVQIRDTSQEGIMTGDKAEHWETAGLSMVTGKPMLTQFYEKDTLFMWADTFYTWSNTAGPERVMRAWNNCRFYKSDMQGVCDSIVYKTEDSAMVLYNSPLLWNGENQLSAREVLIRTGKKSIKYFTLIDDAFVIQKKDSSNYNQLKGRSIEGFFAGDKLNTIKVKGNAQAIYFVEQDKKIVGMNKTDCSEMFIKTSDKGIDKITFVKKPVAVILPIKDVKSDEARLKGFKWSEELRPSKPL